MHKFQSQYVSNKVKKHVLGGESFKSNGYFQLSVRLSHYD